jgi:sugar/nucleoside kinase (ribokinase family)
MTPDFLVVGHVVQDLLEPAPRWQLGGAASYAALLARNLGLNTAVLTACSEDFDVEALLSAIVVRRVAGNTTTQIRNVYPREGEGRREQWIPTRGALLTKDDLPEEWRNAAIVLLGPVAGEVSDSLVTAFGEHTLLGAGAQGWLRQVGTDSRVHQVAPEDWAARQILKAAQALFLSDEDLPADDLGRRPSILERWARAVDCLAYTRGYHGADVHCAGKWRRINAFPSSPVELTGAGDTFAAAFLIRLAETGDPWEATRFASAAASMVIEGRGVEGVPASRSSIEARMNAHPAITAV